MPNLLRHFAIEADDPQRAKAFYETVFGWRFEAWGPPDFYRTADAGIVGAIQKRRAPLTGTGMLGFECSIGVDDLDAILATVAANGGHKTDGPFDIPTVGRLAFIADSEGNRVGVMQYDPAYQF